MLSVCALLLERRCCSWAVLCLRTLLTLQALGLTGWVGAGALPPVQEGT